VLWSCCSCASAQTTSNVFVQHQGDSLGLREPKGQWSFSASVYAYFPPDTHNYLQPTLTADRDWLHLEARYNYEALGAGSAWFGYNFNGGDEVAWEFSPMLGGVIGEVTGIAPGYQGSLRWRTLELYSEGEFVINTADSSASYFYNWSQLTLGVLNGVWVGAVIQHTHVYHSDRDIQRGLLAGLSYKSADLTGYIFNPGDNARAFVVALRLSW